MILLRLENRVLFLFSMCSRWSLTTHVFFLCVSPCGRDELKDNFNLCQSDDALERKLKWIYAPKFIPTIIAILNFMKNPITLPKLLFDNFRKYR